MNKLDQQYINLLKDILENGVEKADRTGTGTISVFGRQFRHDMSEGFPLLTTKKMAVKSMMTELKWFLKGDTNIKYLVDTDVTFGMVMPIRIMHQKLVLVKQSMGLSTKSKPMMSLLKYGVI